MENKLEDKFICGGRYNCQEWECSIDVCLGYADCIRCENKFDPIICEQWKYSKEKRYE